MLDSKFVYYKLYPHSSIASIILSNAKIDNFNIILSSNYIGKPIPNLLDGSLRYHISSFDQDTEFSIYNQSLTIVRSHSAIFKEGVLDNTISTDFIGFEPFKFIN
jgi:hypothetical protein